jgi:hypothetical protein
LIRAIWWSESFAPGLASVGSNPHGSNETIWVEVPDEAVITEPNKAGRTMVWPFYGLENVSIRCFMPGST